MCASVARITPTHDTKPPTVTTVLQKFPNPGEGDLDDIKKLLLDEFSDVFDTSNGLRPMLCKPMKIALKSDVEPYCLSAPRMVPLALRDSAKAELDKLVNLGIIKISTTPSEWCHPLVVVPKKSPGQARICMDFSRLNRFVVRPHHPILTPAEAMARIPHDSTICLLYTSPSPRDRQKSRMPSSA